MAGQLAERSKLATASATSRSPTGRDALGPRLQAAEPNPRTCGRHRRHTSSNQRLLLPVMVRICHSATRRRLQRGHQPGSSGVGGQLGKAESCQPNALPPSTSGRVAVGSSRRRPRGGENRTRWEWAAGRQSSRFGRLHGPLGMLTRLRPSRLVGRLAPTSRRRGSAERPAQLKSPAGLWR